MSETTHYTNSQLRDENHLLRVKIGFLTSDIDNANEAIRRLDEENAMLKDENAALKDRLDGHRFDDEIKGIAKS